MNANTLPAPARVAHPTHRFKLLLQREYWEHKGGFFWAPIWAGIITLLMTLLALLGAEFVSRRGVAEIAEGSERQRFFINGLDINAITSQMSPTDLQRVADGFSMSSATAMFWPLLVLGFVVFFYCLGSLYDERKDRSVLFWKSLPLSDRDTVLSKVVSALVVAPVLATAIGILCMLTLLLMLSVFVVFHNGNALSLLWSPDTLLANAGIAIAALPIYALWALPSAGWLLLCSAWARSKPFLWAILLPVFSGIFLSWIDMMSAFDLGSRWFWKNVIAHLLGGVFPGSWLFQIDPGTVHVSGPRDHAAMLQAMYSVVSTPQLWVGVVAGAAMIFAAIRLRRWREEG